MNDLAVLWTARLCVGCYLLRYVVAAGSRRVGREFGPDRSGIAVNGRDRARQLQRMLWTAGWALLVVHTAAAFQFVHGWSHDDAVASTARQTEELLGISFGGGVWFNYAMIAVWGIDVARWWRRERTPVAWSIAVQAYLALMFVSATVVFGPMWWWAVGGAFLVLMMIATRLQARQPS